MSPYSGGPPRPNTSGGRRPSIASLARSRISARISSSYGGGSGSSRTPAARAARARVASSRGVAARGSHCPSSIVGLVEQGEGELPPEVAWSCVGRIAPALDVIGEEELDSSAQRALHLARARALW